MKNNNGFKWQEQQEKKEKGLVEEKNTDHHQKEDQTHKVLKFPIKEKRQSNQEAYFAGIIDGEGCIAYEKTKKDYSIPSIAVEMSDKDVITRLKDFFGKGSVVFIKPRQKYCDKSQSHLIKSSKTLLLNKVQVKQLRLVFKVET